VYWQSPWSLQRRKLRQNLIPFDFIEEEVELEEVLTVVEEELYRQTTTTTTTTTNRTEGTN